MLTRLLAALVFTSLLVAASAARADSPGPRLVCDDTGLGCTSCYLSAYAADGAPPADYAACAAAAEAKGLVDACHDGGGGANTVHFCPKGVKVELTTVGGGCAIDGGAASGTVAGVLGALGLLALLRRARTARGQARVQR
jgi:hypothetical protein